MIDSEPESRECGKVTLLDEKLTHNDYRLALVALGRDINLECMIYLNQKLYAIVMIWAA
jgi:hypothetical protein